MKNKKRLLIILALCLTLIVAVALAACNPDDNDPNKNDPNKYETAKYTVTFNTNSSFVLENSVVRDIPYGDRVPEPADSNGNKIRPIKEGYTFRYWSEDGSTAFDFTQGITKNTTLTALYANNKYYHTAVLTAKLNYDNGTFTLDKTAREVGDVTLAAAELDKNTTNLTSTYASSGSKLPCPQAQDSQNKFCFWYYMKDGKPVQFSKWRADGDSTVSELASYYYNGDLGADNRYQGLELYPMFSDNLPNVTVRFLDKQGEEDKIVLPSQDVLFGDNISESDEVTDPINKADYAGRVGYKFDYWYYVVESKDSSGNVTYNNKTFVFDKEGEKSPTSPMDAAGAEDNFTPVELKLYSKWTKQITISNVADYKSKLYDVLHKEDPNEQELALIEEILNANIIFTGTLDFGTETFKPLFDAERPFKGTIDGAPKTTTPEAPADEATGTAKAVISGGTFKGNAAASVFGYNQGTIKNIEFKNVKLAVEDSSIESRVYMGVVAHDNAGTIEACDVTLNSVNISLHNVVFGAVTGSNHGAASRNGVIRSCKVTIGGIYFVGCEAVIFGGIAGESDASASLVLDTVDVALSTVQCFDDNIQSNGSSALVIGGLVGVNASHIRLCEVENIQVSNAESRTEFVFGGAVGINTGNLNTTYAIAKLGQKGVPAIVRGSIAAATSIGGLIGKNEGYVLNCYADSSLFVKVDESASQPANLFIGGIVGSNYSAKQDSSSADTGVCAINYSYSVGTINVSVPTDVTCVSVYAGGIAGRNSHKKLLSLFCDVAIEIVNNGENNVGFTFGKMYNNAGVNGRVYFGNSNSIKLTKNSTDYTLTGAQVNEENNEFKANCSFTNIGEATDNANFKSKAWVVGTDDAVPTIKFGVNWTVEENSYPTFKKDIYNDRPVENAD